jgi:adenylate cyclase
LRGKVCKRGLAPRRRSGLLAYNVSVDRFTHARGPVASSETRALAETSVLPSAPTPSRWFTPRRVLRRAPPEDLERAPTVEDIVRWLLGPGRAIGPPAELLHEVSWRLVSAGVALARTTFHIGTLHPQYVSVFCRWLRSSGETLEAAIAHGVQESDAYRRSPMPLVFSGTTVRRQLVAPGAVDEFPIFSELRAEGVTEYLATPIEFPDGRLSAATWSTDRAGGFTVYLGPQTGRRVLAGDITRGSGETIRAVLLFADLRGFTALSERLPASEVIELLNAYFERVVAPIHAHGGEVLKFMGDGLLAIFPIDAPSAGNAEARRAVAATLEAFANLERFNADPGRANGSTMKMAITLHTGDVVYGNIGGEDRLDFTTIGPAVNLVARLQQLSKRVSRPLLMSEEFAALCDRPVFSLGFHPVRGLSDPREVFTLAECEKLGVN